MVECARPDCDLPMVDHLVGVWMEHNATAVDLPFEEVPAGPVMLAGVDPDEQLPLVDHITVASVRSDLDGIPVCGVLLDTAVSQPDAGPRRVWRGVYLSDPRGLRKAGRLLNDAFNHAAGLAQPTRRNRR